MDATRRAISMRGETYERLKLHAQMQDASMSGLAEIFINDRLDALGVPVPESLEPRPPKLEPEPEEIASEADEHFTF